MSERAREVGWTLIRAGFGLAFITHGYAKIFGLTTEGTFKLVVPFISRVEELGFPAAPAFAWAAALTELVGGALIALGVWTRFFALAGMGVMAVAIYSHVTRGDPFSRFELALVYLVVFTALLIGGGGPYSVDGLRAGRGRKIFR